MLRSRKLLTFTAAVALIFMIGPVAGQLGTLYAFIGLMVGVAAGYGGEYVGAWRVARRRRRVHDNMLRDLERTVRMLLPPPRPHDMAIGTPVAVPSLRAVPFGCECGCGGMEAAQGPFSPVGDSLPDAPPTTTDPA